MIQLTKLNGESVFLNEQFIESMESPADTTLRIHNGTCFTVQEKPDEICRRITEWNRQQTTRE